MQFNKIVVQTLAYAQRILTSTVGTELGINQLISTINGNFDALQNLTNNTLSGGGLSDENVKVNGLTNVSTNLTEDYGEQVGGLQVSVLANGQGNFGNTVTPVNRSITTPTANKKVTVVGVTEFQVTDGAAGASVNSNIILEMSYSSAFTSLIKFKQFTPLILPSGNGTWTFQSIPFLVSATCPVASQVYYRVKVGASGNETVVFNVINTTVHASMN